MNPLDAYRLLVKEPRIFLHALMSKIPPCLFPDKLYLKCLYHLRTKRKLNLSNPQTFNEKLQWLKLYDRKPEYTWMVDKIEAKKYVAEKIGEEHIIPTLGVWDNPEDIDFDKLPHQFVLKCNHNSGGLFICKDKSQVSREQFRQIQRRLKKELRYNYYWRTREWPYKNVKRKVFMEKYMVDESGVELKDYKIFCFHGKPYMIQVDFDRFVNHKRNVYFTDWMPAPFEYGYPSDKERIVTCPACLEEMLGFAEKLSENIRFVRVDFYVISGKCYFGELTFFPGDGLEKFSPGAWDEKLGELMCLPNRKIK